MAEIPERLRPWLKQQQWLRDTDSPALQLGNGGSFDDTHLLAPCVAREDGRFLMWYSGASGTRRVYALGLAESTDGKTFTRSGPNPVLQLPGNRRSVLTPTTLREADGTLVREQGKIRLWFSSSDFTAYTPGGAYPPHTLHETWSTDGRLWSEPSPALLPHAYAPSIIKEGSLYRLWYADLGQASWDIRHAHSPDGCAWTLDLEPVLRVDQPWEKANLFYPTVLKVDGIYLMWYGSYWSAHEFKTALGMAASLDGLVWHKNPHNPVFTPDDSRAWESHYTTSETVVRLLDGSWRIWYASRTRPPHRNMYFAMGTARWGGPERD